MSPAGTATADAQQARRQRWHFATALKHDRGVATPVCIAERVDRPVDDQPVADVIGCIAGFNRALAAGDELAGTRTSCALTVNESVGK